MRIFRLASSLNLGLALVLCFGLVSPAVAAETPTVNLPTVYDAKMHFRAILHEHGVEFRWFRYANYKVFKGYEIVRTTVKPKTRLIADGVVAGETANRYSTNFEELLDAGTYYYQLCSVTKTQRICSKAIEVKIKNKLDIGKKPEADAALAPTPVDFKPAPAGQLQLTATKDAVGNVVLNWTPFVDAGAGFKWYKPVRSAAVLEPYYPRDGYLAHLIDINTIAFLDDSAAAGTSNYRICAVDGQDGLFCGNVVTIAK